MLTLIWFIFFTVLTFQDGEDTAEVSGRVAEAVETVVETVMTEPKLDEKALEKQLRFLAHPIGFLVFTILLLLTIRSTIYAGTNAEIFAVTLLILWSILSEILKIPIPGRHYGSVDVAGNLAGVGIGYLIMWRLLLLDA